MGKRLRFMASIIEVVYGALIGFCLAMGESLSIVVVSTISWSLAAAVFARIARLAGMSQLKILSMAFQITAGALAGVFLALGEEAHVRVVSAVGFATANPLLWQVARVTGKRAPWQIDTFAQGAATGAILGLVFSVTNVAEGKALISAPIDVLIGAGICILLGGGYGWARSAKVRKRDRAA